MKRTHIAMIVATILAKASSVPVELANNYRFRELPSDAGKRSRFSGVAAARRAARKMRNSRGA